MNKEPNIIKCKLCNVPFGMSFDKPNDNIYCYTCGETILKFINTFTDNKIKFIPLLAGEFDQGLKHRFGIASKFYLKHLHKNTFNEIKYTDESKYK